VKYGVKLFLCLIIFSLYPLVVSLVRYRKIDTSSLAVIAISLLFICLFNALNGRIADNVLILVFIFSILAFNYYRGLNRTRLEGMEDAFKINNWLELSFGVVIICMIFWVIYVL